MKTLLILFFCLLCTAPSSWAQGYLYAPRELQGVPLLRVPPASKGIGDDAAIRSAHDLSAYCPEPYNQGNTLTCVASAIGAAYAIENAYANQLKNTRQITEQFALSPVYPYRFIPNGCAKGVDFDTMWKVLQDKGNVSMAKTGNKSRCNDVLAQFPASEVTRLSPDSVVVLGTDARESKVRSIVYALSRNRPVVVGMQIAANFRYTKRLYAVSQNYPPLDEKHAVVAVGFDPKKEEIKFLNSYGTSFGENGFFYMKYSAVETEVLRAFTVRKPLRGGGELSGSVGLKVLHYGRDGSGPDYPTVQYTGENVYSFYKTVWPVKDQFQIAGGQEMNGWHIGVINKSPDGKVKIIYPRNVKKPGGHKGLEDEELEAFFSLDSYIPAPDTAMDLQLPAGTDYLCILMSPLPLKPTLLALASSPEVIAGRDFPGSVRNLLKRQMIRKGIQYLPDQLGFTIGKAVDGEIAVMFLKIDSKAR